jgi:hypothetical protein
MSTVEDELANVPIMSRTSSIAALWPIMVEKGNALTPWFSADYMFRCIFNKYGQ